MKTERGSVLKEAMVAVIIAGVLALIFIDKAVTKH
jgi:Tfp pilus assembly protein PilE